MFDKMLCSFLFSFLIYLFVVFFINYLKKNKEEEEKY